MSLLVVLRRNKEGQQMILFDCSQRQRQHQEVEAGSFSTVPYYTIVAVGSAKNRLLGFCNYSHGSFFCKETFYLALSVRE